MKGMGKFTGLREHILTIEPPPRELMSWERELVGKALLAACEYSRRTRELRR